MKKITFLLISLLLISCNNFKKENNRSTENEILRENTAIKNPNEFIPHGYEIVESGLVQNKIRTDLNKDGISDFVILLASGKNNKDYSNAKDIRLAIFEGQNDGSFKLQNQTGNLTSSFLHNNSDKRIEVTHNNIILLKHQSMRHDYELKFRHESGYEDYMLIGAEYNNYNDSDGGNVSTNFISGKRITTNYENKTMNINKKLKSISAISDENIYELLTEKQ